jgi:hypothetical protein
MPLALRSLTSTEETFTIPSPSKPNALPPRFTQNKTRTKIAPSTQGAATMLKRMILTGMVEFTAFGLLSGAVALWAVALSPMR